MNKKTQVLVLGSGPGGYAAAFRAADLGFSVTLVEKYATLGGVCLNVGCIPSKALLHISILRDEVKEMANHGLTYGEPKVDVSKIREFKEGVVKKLTSGLTQLAKARKVDVITGFGKLSSANSIDVETKDGKVSVDFDYLILATGSSALVPKAWQVDDERVMTSTGALKLQDFPKDFLVIGGGVIGLEMGFVYASGGSSVTVIEAGSGIAPGVDRDMMRPLEKKLKTKFKSILTNTKVDSLKKIGEKIEVEFKDSEGKSQKEKFDRVLVSVGRRPNSEGIGLEQAGVKVDEKGFVIVDKQQRTNVANIFAIGDLVGNPMLAHKASSEAVVACDVIHGKKAVWDHKGIPSVIYTNPEIAWVGLTEDQAKSQGIEYKLGKFPWAASGRAIAEMASEGLTKILFDAKTDRILGAAICGKNAGELIGELGLALEMGAVMGDIGGTIHAHPTLSETSSEAAEDLHGFCVHLYSPKKA